ncbi:MAG: PQQ-binding-like beta-propeller repeat protein, partial [Planctomycetaceae bacterium]
MHTPPNKPPAETDDRWTATARQVLKESKVRNGYALVLGIGTGRLAEELLRQSPVRVVAVDSDAGRVARLRARFLRQGVYGTRITLHVGEPATYRFPPYLANLIVSEDVSAFGKTIDTRLVKHIFRALRPYGGSAVLAMPGDKMEAFTAKATVAKLRGARVGTTETSVILTRNGPLPGAADWSHSGANAANAGACQDRFLKGKLGILWYDGSVRWNRKPGSATIRVAGGRVFIMSQDLLAVDVFTGRHLWKTRIPGRSGRAPEFVAVKDRIYIPLGTTCLVLDPSTGGKLREIHVPEKIAKETSAGWSRLRVGGDFLVATFGRHLACLNRRTGKLLWSFRAQHARLSVALGDDRVYCAEIRKLSRKPKPNELKAKPRTQAFDLKSGKVLWTIADASELRYSGDHKLLITTAGIYAAKDGKLVRKHRLLFTVAGDTMISTTASQLTTLNLLTGSRSSQDLKWYRRGCTDLRACANLATTRFQGNAAYVDLATRKITPLWNVRSGCNNNLIPADGVLNVPNLTGGCECNYTPTSLGFVPL